METTSVKFGNDGVPTEGADPIEILINDHRIVKGVLEELPTAVGSQRTDLLERLKALLTIHNATEENLVYPAIHEIALRPVHAGQLYHQQDDAKIIVWKLERFVEQDAEFRQLATKLRDAVLAHAKHEEETEFPKLREAADPEQMAALASAVREFRASFRFAPR